MAEYLFRRFRPDDWPLCPNCEEDELHSPCATRFWSHPLSERFDGEFTCSHCGWSSQGHRHDPQAVRSDARYPGG